jgi:hypothetical protein
MATQSDYLARIISIILGPHVWLPVLFILIILKSGLTPDQLKIIFPTVLLLQVIIPISYLLFAPRLGWIKGWEMKDKKERKPFMYLIVALGLVSLAVVYFFGNQFVFGLSLIWLILLAVLLLITRIWKISLHMGLIVASTIIVNFLFDWKLPILYLMIPILFWARLELKRHSVTQLLAGVAVTAFILIGGFVLLGYI